MRHNVVYESRSVSGLANAGRINPIVVRLAGNMRKHLNGILYSLLRELYVIIKTTKIIKIMVIAPAHSKASIIQAFKVCSSLIGLKEGFYEDGNFVDE